MRGYKSLGLALITSCALVTAGCNQKSTSDTDMMQGLADMPAGGGGDMRKGGGVDMPIQNGPDLSMPDMKLTGVSQTVHVGTGGQPVYNPKTISINVGDAIHWVWDSANHNVASGTPLGNTDDMYCSPNNTNCDNPDPSNTGATYDHGFTTPGTYFYFSTVGNDFFNGMVGCVAVGPDAMCQF